MKSKLILLAEDDHKARDLIRENLEVRAHDHTLSRKLLHYFARWGGPMRAIAPDWLNFNELASYSDGSLAPPGSPSYYAKGESTRDRLIMFVEEYLSVSNDAVAVCENSGAIRKRPEFWSWGPAPPMLFYRAEEIYHVLSSSGTNHEMIDNAISDSLGHWGTTVCSSSKYIPEGTLHDDSFLDEIVQNTKHICVPAFDHGGYMIWSPTGGNRYGTGVK